MAGIGPPPKDPSKRARKNKDVVPLRIVEVQPARQPELPSFTVMVTIDNQLVTQEFEWPAMTRDWWAMLANHPLAPEFIETDWAYLMETARLHAEFWMGKMSLAGEIRLREAKYGFTPEDRARLRLQFAQATGAEVDTKRKLSVSSRDRFGGIALPPEATAN
ncbi:hypothetical protein KK103_11890 [Curtobacterium flaccumfaciens pv. flaccumfaciens]|jgi:hypothetical protein|uniref:Uncharacterized protein n=1 Tax=Curtobacterium flaccumfaciens pv. flaccumfaciens TaxID=138532 RepID=A0A9Q2ZL32_9MICO|nr:hypothetical protein [Curtobacterium flaccumfaciens]MBT1542466.1 hypothetical protein [Curtobacterium flaccumfaciens pv. flaccumfaciens]